MGRLTKKYDDNSGYEILENNTTCNTMYDVPWTDVENCVDKLGRLEDLEEELGCSLDVVFKALNEGIYIATEKIDFFLRPRLYFSDDYKNWCFELAFGGYVVHLKDYQKTWWLKGEK